MTSSDRNGRTTSSGRSECMTSSGRNGRNEDTTSFGRNGRNEGTTSSGRSEYTQALKAASVIKPMCVQEKLWTQRT